MSTHETPPSGRASAAPSIAERLATAALCLAILVGPIALGGTPIAARLALEAVMATAILLWLAGGRATAGSALAPLAIAAAACVQIVPMPIAILRWVAPLAADAWTQATGTGWGTASVDPAATAAAIRRLLLGVATVAAVADLARSARLRGWLLGAVSASALVVWSLGLVFPVDAKERILLGVADLKGPIEFWRTEIAEPVQTAGTGTYEAVRVGNAEYAMPGWSIGDGFGSYVVSNHFAAAIYLTLPVALGLWLSVTAGRRAAAFRYGVVVGALAAAVWTVGPLASSRAGAAAMLLAGLVLLTRTVDAGRWQRIASIACWAYAALLLLFMVAFFGPWRGVVQVVPEGVQWALRGLRSDGRVVATRVAGQMLADGPLLGTGLDTFGELQRHYLGNVYLLHYAHNDYVQLLAESGLLGAGIACGLGAWLISRSRRAVASPMRAVSAGPWAALAGLTFHSAFDWNMHVPANAFLAAIVAGLAIAQQPPPGPPAAGDGNDSRLLRRLPGSLLAIACGFSIALLARDAVSGMARRELALAIVECRKIPGDQAMPPDRLRVLTAALAQGERAAAWSPHDAILAERMGQACLYLGLYRGEDSLDLARDPAAWFARARRSSPCSRGLRERTRDSTDE